MENTVALDLSIVFAILSGKVSRAINRELYRSYREAGFDVTPEQNLVLLYLWYKDGVTQQEIASATYHDKPSVTRLLDNMEKNGLVVRVTSKNDKRSNLVYLTKKGREFKMALSPISLSVMNKAISGLSKDEVETAEYLFRKVFCNLK